MTNGKKGAKAKLLEFLLKNIGTTLNSKELSEVAGASEWGRRMRELRDEQGYQILSHNDRSDLKPGEYVLVTAIRNPATARGISKETRALVLDRDGFTCQMCGSAAGEPHVFDSSKKTRLHIGHIKDKSMGGSDEPENLRAICSICNEGASNQTLPRPDSIRLISIVRRAPTHDQIQLMEWLKNKFKMPEDQ